MARSFIIPDLKDDRGRAPIGARVRATRTDTHAFVEETLVDKYGNATFSALPTDVDVVFHATWGGTTTGLKERWFYSHINAVTEGGTGASDAATARTNLGIGIGDSPQFTAIELGHATDTTISRVSAGLIAVEGSNLIRASDVDDTPVNGQTAVPVSSNWAYDHAAIDAAADDTTKGHATFEADDFDDASGKIDLATSVCKAVAGDSGTATPSTHQVTVAGTAPISTAGASATVTVSLDADGIDKTHLSQDFGASGGRLRNVVMTPVGGYIFYMLACSGGTFSGAIDDNAGAHGGQGLDATHVPYDGDTYEDMFNGLSAYHTDNYWGQIILHNITRGNSRKIVSVDRTNNVITTTSSTDDWADNDVIDCESQTNLGAGSLQFADLDLSDHIGTNVDSIIISLWFADKAAIDDPQNIIYFHTYESYNVAKRQQCACTLANEVTIMQLIIPVVDQKTTFYVRSDGGGNLTIALTVLGTIEFADT